jgi:uncharacterized membrane protein
MDRIILFFLVLILSGDLWGQNATVKGKVMHGATPLESVVVKLENTNYATLTNENGEFLFSEIPFGNYTLLISMTGYRQEKVSIEVKKLS